MLFVVKLELEIAEKWIDIEDEEEEEIVNAELDEDLEALAGEWNYWLSYVWNDGEEVLGEYICSGEGTDYSF